MLELFLLCSIAVYTLRSLFFIVGSAMERRRASADPTEWPFISIIVPARNEELNILRCIESLSALDYDASKMEIIVVDDRSSDGTATILKMQQLRFPELRIVSIREDGVKNLQGKAGALEYGIRQSKGEFVLMTDADCAVDSGWAKAHVRAYTSQSVGIVCSYTLVSGDSFFDRLQAVEWNSTHTMASAAVFFRQYLGCYGNNISVRRSAYDAVGGYSSIKFSVTEDLALLQAITKSGAAARYLCSPESSVTTYALQTLSEYVEQHKRWTLGGKQLGPRAVVFVLTSAALWAGIIASVVEQQWLWFGVILLVRVIEDFAINMPAMLIMRRTRLLPYIIPAVLFFTVLELILPFLIIDRRAEWKGQTFHT